jgi:hypothetical protein
MEVDVKPTAISLSYTQGSSRRPNRQAVSPRLSVGCGVIIAWQKQRGMESYSFSCCLRIALFVHTQIVKGAMVPCNHVNAIREINAQPVDTHWVVLLSTKEHHRTWMQQYGLLTSSCACICTVNLVESRVILMPSCTLLATKDRGGRSQPASAGALTRTSNGKTAAVCGAMQCQCITESISEEAAHQIGAILRIRQVASHSGTFLVVGLVSLS